MNRVMRAKLKVTNVEKYTDGERLTMTAVCPNEFDPEGLDENNTYAKYTPSADLSMYVHNPDLLGKIEKGQEYYLDFTLVK